MGWIGGVARPHVMATSCPPAVPAACGLQCSRCKGLWHGDLGLLNHTARRGPRGTARVRASVSWFFKLVPMMSPAACSLSRFHVLAPTEP